MSIQTKKRDDSEPDVITQMIQGAMSKFHGIEADFESTRKYIATMQENIDIVKGSINTLLDFSKIQAEKASNGFAITNAQMANIVSALDTIRKDQQDGEAKSRALTNVMYQHSDRISDVEKSIKSLPSMHNIIDLSNDTKSLEQTTKYSIQQHETLMSEHSEGITKLKNALDILTLDVKKSWETINQLKQTTEAAHLTNSAIKSKLESSFSYIEKYTDDKISACLNSIPKPVILTKEQVQTQIDAKHEGVRLDASNANLRSENTEKKITILERKIEQLQLLINKLQLQG